MLLCDLVENFRPISVLPVVVKVLERLVHRQLYAYLQGNNLLRSTQFGFRPGHSSQDVLYIGSQLWLMVRRDAHTYVTHSQMITPQLQVAVKLGS